MIKKIAKITGTFLGIQDHGLLTAMLYVDYGSALQGIGGYSFGTPKNPNKYMAQFVSRTLTACGVDTWEKLPGKTIFVLFEGDEWGSPVGIENLPTEKGETFIFSEQMK